jgi:hypothetical protein
MHAPRRPLFGQQAMIRFGSGSRGNSFGLITSVTFAPVQARLRSLVKDGSGCRGAWAPAGQASRLSLRGL